MKFTALIISTVVSLSTVSETSIFVLQPTFTLRKSIVRGAAQNAVLVAEEMAKNGALEEAKSILV